MVDAVRFLQTALPQTAAVSQMVDRSLASGQTLAAALKPCVSPNLFCQLQLADKHGRLGESLAEIGKFLAAELKQRRKLFALLQYPLLLLVLLVGMLVALQIFVFPEIQSWQTANHSQPLLVGQWIGLAGGGIVMTLLGTLFGWLIRYWRSPVITRINMLCKLPVLKRSFRLYYCYFLVTNLAVMLKHGLSLAEVGEVTESFAPNTLLHHLGRSIKAAGQNGADLPTVLTQYPFVPPELPMLFIKGATQQKLGADLTVFAKVQFQRLLTGLEQLLNLVQPVIFILIAVVIVGMYLSILLPIYHSLAGVY